MANLLIVRHRPMDVEGLAAWLALWLSQLRDRRVGGLGGTRTPLLSQLMNVVDVGLSVFSMGRVWGAGFFAAPFAESPAKGSSPPSSADLAGRLSKVGRNLKACSNLVLLLVRSSDCGLLRCTQVAGK